MIEQISLPFISLSSFLALAEVYADRHGTTLLYSGGSLDSAERSFLALFPFESAVIYGHSLRYQKGCRQQSFEVQDPWEGLQNHFFDSLAADSASMTFGWFGYGMGAFADKEREMPYRPSSTPDAYWQRCAAVLIFDHRLNCAFANLDFAAKEYVDRQTFISLEALSFAEGWEQILRQASSPPRQREEHPPVHSFPDCPEKRAHYLDNVSIVQELIRAGEVYQVNLSQQFQFRGNRHPFSLYHDVCMRNPAPFSAYIRYEQMAIVSSSPERFLCKRGQILEARPIKGTIQRGATDEEDIQLKNSLLTSSKERAELLMITDLIRNDLGKISVAGSVETLDLWRCEAYTNVFHMVSIIRSIVNDTLKPLEIVRECFPGGSITGCPKLSAMEIIDALEKRPRGIYTGSIGYFTGTGDFDLNIAIRTLIAEGGIFSLQLGGAIVIDSIPEQEFREILYKGASFFHLLQNSPAHQTKEIL